MAYPIVDLKRSEWDAEKSNPEMGEYYFTKKVYYLTKDFKEGYIHPFKIKWCKYSEQDYPRPFATLHSWKLSFGAELLTVGDDYWPDGHVPDAEGKYVTGDLVCVKIPIEKHVATRRAAVKKSDDFAKNSKARFLAEMQADGASQGERLLEEEEERMKKEAEMEGM